MNDPNTIGNLIQLGFFVLMFGLGYFVGSFLEARHYAAIEQREKELKIPMVSVGHAFDESQVIKSQLVCGSVVISIDYFKRVVAILKNLFGGNIKSYETLIDRARREAVLRMAEDAKDADLIVNMRLETTSIGGRTNRRSGIGSVECFAYGTAIWQSKA